MTLSNGGGTYTTLNVNNLTANVTPASGTDGILFTSNGTVELNAHPGPFAIFATDATGIFAASNTSTVTIRSSADIFTTGSGATGLQGSGQDALLTIVSSGDIATSGNNAFGIAAGTVYGDIIVTSTGDIATSGMFAAGINVGTIGQLNTSEGAVTITSSGDIATSGSSAIGINAASVYGPIDITSLGDIAVSGAASIGINAQTQGEIRITTTGDIATAGDDGVGIFAAAGAAAMVFSSGSIVTLGDGAAGIAAAGQTGTVIVSTGNIRTYGADAPGITVYSDGDAAVASSGDIRTTGDTSDGIYVVSTYGRAAVVNSGDISATGPGSAGIYAASYAGTSVVNFGAITGCPCGGVVLRTYDGDNSLINFGTIIADLNGSAIEMDTITGSNLVENFGTVTGNVFMAGVASVFENQAGAFFNSGEDIIADVNNAGTLAPGGSGTVETTDTIGSLTQSGSGRFAVDIIGTAADRINVTDTAQLAGKVAVGISIFPTVAAQSFTILQATGGVTDDGLGLSASPLLHATLTFPNATDVVLGIAVDFRVDGLNPNQRAIADNLGQIFAAGGGGVSSVLLGLLNVGDLTEFKNALDQLSPEIYSNAEIAALYGSFAFSNSLLSCKVNGTDTASIIREGQCLWAGASAAFLDSSTTTDQIGFTQVAGLFNAGAQVALDNVWRLGFAGGFQSSSLQTSTGAQSEGFLAQGGVSLKYNPGQLLLAGAVTGGGGWYDTTRTMSFGGFTGVAEGEQTLGVFNAALRAAYVFGDPRLFFKPIVDASLTHLELGGFTESGGNGAALSVAGGGNTVFSLAPMLEAGTEWWLANGTLVRPLLRGGAVWYEGGDFALTASFAGAPAGVSSFTINTDIDEIMGLVGAGVEVINGGDSVLRLSYDGQLGSDTQIHSVGIKGSARF